MSWVPTSSHEAAVQGLVAGAAAGDHGDLEGDPRSAVGPTAPGAGLERFWGVEKFRTSRSCSARKGLGFHQEFAHCVAWLVVVNPGLSIRKECNNCVEQWQPYMTNHQILFDKMRKTREAKHKQMKMQKQRNLLCFCMCFAFCFFIV